MIVMIMVIIRLYLLVQVPSPGLMFDFQDNHDDCDCHDDDNDHNHDDDNYHDHDDHKIISRCQSIKTEVGIYKDNHHDLNQSSWYYY